MSLIKQRIKALFAARFSSASETGRIRGHQAEVRLFDEVLWDRYRVLAHQALSTISREGRHTAYGLVYTCATRPLIDPRTVLMVRRSEGMSMKLAAEVLRHRWLTGER